MVGNGQPAGEPGFKATLLHTSESVPVVSAFGEIDVSSADGLRTVISEALSRMSAAKTIGEINEANEANGCMILDLSGVDFMDSMGLGVILEARRELLEASGETPVLVCNGNVCDLLGAAGFSEFFEIYGDLESAVSGCSAGSPG